MFISAINSSSWISLTSIIISYFLYLSNNEILLFKEIGYKWSNYLIYIGDIPFSFQQLCSMSFEALAQIEMDLSYHFHMSTFKHCHYIFLLLSPLNNNHNYKLFGPTHTWSPLVHYHKFTIILAAHKIWCKRTIHINTEG